jgi:hypothetical protein
MRPDITHEITNILNHINTRAEQRETSQALKAKEKSKKTVQKDIADRRKELKQLQEHLEDGLPLKNTLVQQIDALKSKGRSTAFPSFLTNWFRTNTTDLNEKTKQENSISQTDKDMEMRSHPEKYRHRKELFAASCLGISAGFIFKAVAPLNPAVETINTPFNFNPEATKLPDSTANVPNNAQIDPDAPTAVTPPSSDQTPSSDATNNAGGSDLEITPGEEVISQSMEQMIGSYLLFIGAFMAIFMLATFIYNGINDNKKAKTAIKTDQLNEAFMAQDKELETALKAEQKRQSDAARAGR